MISRWTLRHGHPTTVIDVGAGVGAFTVAASQSWPNAEVKAIDINPVTLGLLALLDGGSGSHQYGERLELICDDYVSWVEKHWSSMTPGRLVLGNPPYTRAQLIPLADRARLEAAAAGLCGSRASLSAFITAVTLKLLDEKDGLCLLLPAQWLEADYAVGIRSWLWRSTYRPIDLHLFDAELFAEAQVDAVALLVGPTATSPQPLVVSRDGGAGSAEREVERSSAMPPHWRALFVEEKRRGSGSIKSESLRSVAAVRRGIATGANRFFVISDELAMRHRLPSNALKPLVHRLRNYEADVVTAEGLGAVDGKERTRLFLPGHEELHDSVVRYIALGLTEGAHEGLLSARRGARWFDLSREYYVPDIIVSPTGKYRFRFVENPAGAAITNNLYGLIWRPEVPLDYRSALLEWLRSGTGQEALRAVARTQGGGLLKLEPGALQSLSLPSELVPVDLRLA